MIVPRQDRARRRAVQPGGLGRRHQHRGIAGIAPFGEIGGEQRVLQRDLPPLSRLARPVKQAMRVEGVVDARAGALRHLEPQIGGHLADPLARGAAVAAGRRAVFLAHMLAQILPAGRHVRVQLERDEPDVGARHVRHLVQRAFQPAQADHAPGADDIRDELDRQRRHAGSPVRRGHHGPRRRRRQVAAKSPGGSRFHGRGSGSNGRRCTTFM